MQEDSPDDDLLLREAIASLGPGAKDFTLDDVAAWIRQLKEMCNSQDAALAPASFRTDINGSCRCTFPEHGQKPATTAQTIKLQTNAIKGYPPLPELHMKKVISNKKNARGEAKLRLSVDRGPVLVMLTITDLDGATHTLHAVTADANDLTPIRNPATTIEATVVPCAPDELLARLRRVEAKIQRQRAQHADEQVLEYIYDTKKDTMTVKSSGCSNPDCDEANFTCAPTTYTWNVKTGEADYTTCDRRAASVISTSFETRRHRQRTLAKRGVTIAKEEKAIHQKLSTAKPAEKKRLRKELEKKNAEFAKLKDLMDRTARTGGWLSVPEAELNALVEEAKPKDPERVNALSRRAVAAFDDYNTIIEKLGSTSSQTNVNRLSKLLERKEIEFEEAMNDIAAIADGSEDDCGQGYAEDEDGSDPEDAEHEDDSEQQDSKVLKGVSDRMLVALLLVFTSLLVISLVVLYTLLYSY